MIFIILLGFVSIATAENRIINGLDAKSMIPWQVSLQLTGRHFCGGSLIDAGFVMTACHCKLDDVTVGIGSLDYRYPKHVIKAETFTCHPDWKRLLIDYDYAVIKLEWPVTLDYQDVDIIHLPRSGEEFPDGTQALISGWGLTEGTADEVPTALQFAHTKLIEAKRCYVEMKEIKRITNRMQCAGLEGNSACNGDSGGPLTIQREDGSWVLVGNTSFGVVRCPTWMPSVWSKNSAVIPWILGQIGASAV